MQRLITTVALIYIVATAAAQSAPPVQFDIGPQSLSAALVRFSEQAKLQFTAPGKSLSGIKTAGVTGKYPTSDALALLLRDTGLTFRFIDDRTVSIQAEREKKTSDAGQVGTLELAQTHQAMQKVKKTEEQSSPEGKETSTAETSAEENESQKGTPEILVKGSRSTNADIVRTESDAQPYVVFTREQLESSMVSSLEDFLKTRLPMNAAQTSNGQITAVGAEYGNQSTVNLRGLGANQTLILVNGRRMPSVSNIVYGDLNQPDINGIALAAVERIEVLPSTASGIYGGGATGGVINIVLKQDYMGVELASTYENTFDTDAARRRLDANAGLSFRGGRTQVQVSGSFSDANSLRVGDREVAGRSRRLLLANDPDALGMGGVPVKGYTTNIVGLNPVTFAVANLVMDDGTPLGSSITSVPLGYAGVASDGGAALRANAGRYNVDLPDSVAGARRSLLNHPTVSSLAVSVRNHFGARVETFVDASLFENKGLVIAAGVPDTGFMFADDPANPFQQVIRFTFPVPDPALERQIHSQSETLRATVGAIVRLPHGWTVQPEYGWSRSRSGYRQDVPAVYSSVNDAFRSGQLNVLRDVNAFPVDYSAYLLPGGPTRVSGPNDTVLQDVTARFAGPLLTLPAGPLALSGLIERRKEKLDGAFFESVSASNGTRSFFYYPARSQSVSSTYLEALLPLIAPGNARTVVRALELQASVRRDAYETRAPIDATMSLPSRQAPAPATDYSTNKISSVDYTVALRYSPVASLMLRASYGTGFLAPSLSQIVPVPVDAAGSQLLDPRRGNTYTPPLDPLTWVFGGSPQLRPEQSASFSAGAVFTPDFLRGLRVSLDYTRIDKSDEIASVGENVILQYEAAFPERVRRAPLESPAPPGFTAGPIVFIDSSVINIAAAEVRSYDVQADYTWNLGERGEVSVFALGTIQKTFKRQLLPDVTGTDSVGFSDGPLKLRANGGLTWRRGPWTLGWSAQYYDSYLVHASTASPQSAAAVARQQGSDTVPNQMYHDVFAGLRLDRSFSPLRGLLSDAQIQLGIRNIFDKAPPILALVTDVAGGYSGYGDPRLRSYSISIRKAFH